MGERASIIINCSQLESDLVHRQARLQRRSISGYVLRIVMASVELDEDMLRDVPRPARPTWYSSTRVPGPRTTFLLRCPREESDRIRAAAKRRDTTLSGFVLHALRRAWKVQKEIGRIRPEFPAELKLES
jgi:uncharacterized protein (DUF1778 family)